MVFTIFDTITAIPAVILQLWWLWLFIALFLLARSLWLAYAQEIFKKKNSWMLLELQIPREVERNPRAMEQVFMAIHSVKNSPATAKEKWWYGEGPLWFSCEAVSFGGEIHFYFWTPSKHRNMIEAAFYANYPDVEIREASDDYIYRFPPTFRELAGQGYDIFGNELVLSKEDAYPIRTYIDFEAKQEEFQLDPIASLFEILTKVKPQEHVWIQFLIRPKVDDSWKKSGEKLIAELKEKVGRRQVMTSFGEMVMIDRTPGETEVMKLIEKNIEKPGFDAVIRYLYIAPKDIYDSNFGQRAVQGALNQYASEALNKFGHNVFAWTRASLWFWPYLFPDKRTRARKDRMYFKFRLRKMYGESIMSALAEMKFFDWGTRAWKKSKMVLNVEELATIFHIPMKVVLTGPLIKRIEARRVGPPAGLPIYEDEDEKLPGT